MIHLPVSTFHHLRLKTVDVLIRSLDDAESQVRKNESRLSEEDIVPADTTAIQNLRDQLEVKDTSPHKPAKEKRCQTV